MVDEIVFPKDFLFGTSTSSFQIETPVDHQLKGLIGKDGTKLVETIEHEKHRYSDASIIAKLGNAYRFSLDWGRLQTYPFERFEGNVVKEYRIFLNRLKKKGVKLMLVLHHFANPNWFEHHGSWLNSKAIDMYLDYVEQVHHHFGDLVDYYNTFNEPGVFALHTHMTGFFPPYKRMKLFAVRKILNNMAKASNKAYDMLKDNSSDVQVGFAKSILNPLPVNFAGGITALGYEIFFIDYILKKFSKHDYIGINYYGYMPMGLIPFSRPDNKNKFDGLRKEHDDLWIYDPKDLKKIIMKLHRKYKKPIIITENGYSGENDNRRLSFIADHLKSIHEAMDEGIVVKGYFYWSTFDNYELYLGKTFRFGLVHVNYKTMKRTLKGSAKFYSKLSKYKVLEV